MFANVVSALLFQFGKFLIGMRDQVAKRLEQFVFLSGNGIDDWTKLVFIQKFITFRFAAADGHNALAHGFQRVHCRRVGIKLVHNDVRSAQAAFVFLKRKIFHAVNFAQVGMSFLDFLQHGQQDIHAFIDGSGALDAHEEAKFFAALCFLFRFF